MYYYIVEAVILAVCIGDEIFRDRRRQLSGWKRQQCKENREVSWSLHLVELVVLGQIGGCRQAGQEQPSWPKMTAGQCPQPSRLLFPFMFLNNANLFTIYFNNIEGIILPSNICSTLTNQ